MILLDIIFPLIFTVYMSWPIITKKYIFLFQFRKSKLLSRDDLVLPWKPLYQLLERILCSQYEILGLEWTPR